MATPLSPSTALGEYNATPPTYADGDHTVLQTDDEGNLKVVVTSGGTDQDVNLVGINGVAPSVGAGTVGTGVQRVTLASNDPAVSALGAVADAAVTNPASSASVIAALKGALTYLANFVFGAGTATAALRTTLASNDPAVVALAGGLPASLGPKAPSASLAVVPAVLTPDRIAAGSTTEPFGATGAAGDYLSHIVLQPAATNAGTTTLFNSGTTVYVYTAGTLSDLRPITVPINAVSVGGSWNVTTGSNMAVTGFGTFT
jgi:hypothetical protein